MMDWINSEQGITVLRTLFLLVLLVWLLTNGFSYFVGRSKGHRDKKRSNREHDE